MNTDGVSFVLEYCPKCQGMRMAERRVIGRDMLGDTSTLTCVKCKTVLTGTETPWPAPDPPLDSRALGDLDLMK